MFLQSLLSSVSLWHEFSTPLMTKAFKVKEFDRQSICSVFFMTENFQSKKVSHRRDSISCQNVEQLSCFHGVDRSSHQNLIVVDCVQTSKAVIRNLWNKYHYYLPISKNILLSTLLFPS